MSHLSSLFTVILSNSYFSASHIRMPPCEPGSKALVKSRQIEVITLTASPFFMRPISLKQKKENKLYWLDNLFWTNPCQLLWITLLSRHLQMVLPFVPVFFQSSKLVWLVTNSLDSILLFSSRSFFYFFWSLRHIFLFMAMLVLQDRLQPDTPLCYHPHFASPHGWLGMPLAWGNCPDTGLWAVVPCLCPCPSCTQGQSLWGKHLQKPLLPDIGSTVVPKSVLGLMTADFICITVPVCWCRRYVNVCESICNSRVMLPFIDTPASESMYSMYSRRLDAVLGKFLFLRFPVAETQALIPEILLK